MHREQKLEHLLKGIQNLKDATRSLAFAPIVHKLSRNQIYTRFSHFRDPDADKNVASFAACMLVGGNAPG